MGGGGGGMGAMRGMTLDDLPEDLRNLIMQRQNAGSAPSPAALPSPRSMDTPGYGFRPSMYSSPPPGMDGYKQPALIAGLTPEPAAPAAAPAARKNPFVQDDGPTPWTKKGHTGGHPFGR